MSGAAISPNSLNLFIGGSSDAGARHSKMMEVGTAAFAAISSFRHSTNQQRTISSPIYINNTFYVAVTSSV
jgi:hypothetical protein